MNPLAKVNKSASSCRLEVLQGALQIRLEQVENILIIIKLEKWPFVAWLFWGVSEEDGYYIALSKESSML